MKKKLIVAFCTIFSFAISSCFYDPPFDGRVIEIFNQTNESIVVLRSLKGDSINLYYTGTHKGRKNINRLPEYLSDYGNYHFFIKKEEFDNNNNSSIQFYIIKASDSRKQLTEISNRHLYRSIAIDASILKKQELNHLFIYPDTLILEHDLNIENN